MTGYEEALSAVLSESEPLKTVQTPLSQLYGTVLAESIVAPFDVPLFDNSAVDGYGVRANADVRSNLKVVSKIPAGRAASAVRVAEGEAVQIFTGAAVPEDVDAVVMQEDVASENGCIALNKVVTKGENIRRQGSEFTKGETVFEPGTRVTPPVYAQIAAFGLASAKAYAMPRVGILVTGSELVEPGKPRAEGQIYESNSFGLAAMLREIGIDDARVLRSTDDQVATMSALSALLKECDVVITSGGVSVGDLDLVRPAFEKLGVEMKFWRVAIKPGKPLFFGIWNGDGRKVLVFGLPGNPVSSMVCSHLFVSPAIRKVCGETAPYSTVLTARLVEPIRRMPGRMEFMRGKLEMQGTSLFATALPSQGSNMIGGLARADALIHVPVDVESLDKGAEVAVTPLRWSWPL